jgi:hypothetical protein
MKEAEATRAEDAARVLQEEAELLRGESATMKEGERQLECVPC